MTVYIPVSYMNEQPNFQQADSILGFTRLIFRFTTYVMPKNKFEVYAFLMFPFTTVTVVVSHVRDSIT